MGKGILQTLMRHRSPQELNLYHFIWVSHKMWARPRRFVSVLLSPRVRNALQRFRRRKRNVFKSNYERRVLLSYLTAPWRTGITYAHSSLRECYTAAEIFHNLGYRVDVVDYSTNRRIDYSEYEIIYGMGPVLERSFYSQEGSRRVRIFYATGCNPIYSNIVTTLKVRDFYVRHKQLLMESSRIVNEIQNAQILLSDGVIVLGNEFVLDTYTRYDPEGAERYYRLNAFFNDCYDIDLAKKDFESAKKHFLWFGSGGLLHKGLDLLLEIFSERSDIYLHICGAPTRESGFFRYYDDLLSRSRNIVNHGFVKMESVAFKTLMDMCGYAVFPSASEGGASALLNTMANGALVPIITTSSGLDLEEHGWLIQNQDFDKFRKAIDQAMSIENPALKDKAIKIKDHVRRNYSLERYKSNLHKILREILERG